MSWRKEAGRPKRKLKTSPGGVLQDSIYQSPRLINYLEKITGYSIIPTGQRGTYSFYLEEEDFLDIHRDINSCDLTLITCLKSNIKNSSSGSLYLFTGRKNDTMSSLYRNRNWGYETIQLRVGQSILIEGGILPHGVNPLERGDQRIISALCFRRY